MKKKKKYQHEGYDGMGDADSMHSRLSNKKSMKNSKSIQQMLDIEDVGHEPLNKNPLSLMDILSSTYEDSGDAFYEKGDEDEQEE